MDDLRLGLVESRFADIIWDNAPLTSRELVTLCEKVLGWKKSTTYTVLKRLCDRGLFCNENGTVRPKITREEFISAQSEKFVDDTFAGSLPAFVAAFTRRKRLSDGEIAEIRRMIDAIGKE